MSIDTRKVYFSNSGQWKKYISFTSILALFVLIVGPHAAVSVDWHYFRDAIHIFFDGKSPYTVKGFFNPPWILIPLAPLALLPEGWGSVCIMAVTITSYLYITLYFRASRLAVLAFMLSPLVILDVLKTNINWMIPMGLLLPPKYGLFLVLAKPQVGVGIAIYWFIERYKAGGVREVFYTFWPVTASFLLSFLLYGPYPLSTNDIIRGISNFSLWPWGIPFGFALIAYAWRQRKINTCMAAGPMLSPYFGDTNWVVPALSTLDHPRLTLAITLLEWVIVLVIAIFSLHR